MIGGDGDGLSIVHRGALYAKVFFGSDGIYINATCSRNAHAGRHTHTHTHTEDAHTYT